MNRYTVIQEIIKNKNAKSYLEIGVERGEVFFNIQVDFKIGVDPNFLFKLKKPINEKLILQDSALFQMTSDAFFSKESEIIKNGVDVVFIDGLHTYQQVIKDIKNALSYLNDDGVIIIHDCNPTSEAIGYPVKNSINEVINLASQGLINGWNGCWCGDVWKALLHFRVEYPDLNIFTLDLDWGLGIITRASASSAEELKVNLDKNQIAALDYQYLNDNRNDILNLKSPLYLFDFLSQNNKINLKAIT